MKKLALCAGHYLGTEDRRCLKKYDPNKTQEWVLNDRVADRVEKLLAPYGVEVLRVDDTTGKTYRSLKTRTNCANEWGADFWLGIHHNAGVKGGKGGGITAYVYTKPDADSLDWQKKLYKSLIEHSPELKGNRATPLAKANLAECRDTKMPAVLLELGFMDSSTDIPIIITDEHADKCAKAIVEVIVEKWDLEVKTDKAKTDTLYHVQIGAYRNKNEADEMLRKVKNAGFEACITTSTGNIKVGDVVRLNKGAKTYTGVGLASFVYERDHIVSQVNGERVVITYDGYTVAAVNVSDLTFVR